MSALHHVVKNRPRLLLSIALGVFVTFFILPNGWLWITRALTGWDIGIGFFLILTGWHMLRANHHHVKELASREDRSNVAVFTLMTMAAGTSIIAIVMDLSGLKDVPQSIKMMHYALTALTILLSWLFIGVLFTLNYARMYYRSPIDTHHLVFVDHDLIPDYWDFLYFSFTIAVAAQTADVAISSRSMRKVVLAHSVMSFLFNLIILGLSINIAAGVISG